MYWLTERVPSWPSAVKALSVSLKLLLPDELVRWCRWCMPGERGAREDVDGEGEGDARWSSGAIWIIASGDAERWIGDDERGGVVKGASAVPSTGVGGSSENECGGACCSASDGFRGVGARISGAASGVGVGEAKAGEGSAMSGEDEGGDDVAFVDVASDDGSGLSLGPSVLASVGTTALRLLAGRLPSLRRPHSSRFFHANAIWESVAREK